MNKTEKFTAGFGISYVVMSFVNTLMIIVKEKVPSVMALMKSALGHHWTTHGVVLLTLYVVFGLALSGANAGRDTDPAKLLNLAIGATIINVAVIAIFYLLD